MPIIYEDQCKTAAQLIRDEAERRLDAGITVNGKAFRADDVSAQRIGEMAAVLEAGPASPEGVTFRTRAGTALALTTPAQARTILAALLRYRAACLGASAALQASPPADFRSDGHWPTPEAVVL